MKRLISIFPILIVLLIVTETYGQNTKYEVGFEGGPSRIRIRLDKRIRKYMPSELGFASGVFGQVNLNKTISLRTNIHFDRKGFSAGKIFYPDPATKITETANYIYNYDYLTLPILFRANFGKKIKFFVNAGPFFGYLVNTRTFVQDKGSKNSTIYINGNNAALFRKTEPGISSGLGFYWPLKSKHSLSFELRNSLGAKSPNGHGNNATSLLIGLTRSFGAK
jgi:Outer membrane protein beta-barrel domain